MTSESEETQAGSADPAAENTERDQISANIAAVLEFYAREELKVSRSQKVLERISMAVGQPYFLALILVFVALWVSANVLLGLTGRVEFDPAPFSWLQGIIGLGALMTATAVLSKQNRLTR
jgi:uncharacterized membrane protein